MNNNPIEGIDGSSNEDELFKILNKYGIKIATSHFSPLTPSPHLSFASSLPRPVTITLWGTGNPRREFLHVNDMADAYVYFMNNVDFSDLTKRKKEIKNTHINIGCGKDQSLKELAELVKGVVGYKGIIQWDKTKPDGTLRKLMDVNQLKTLGWSYNIVLQKGLKKKLQ